MTDRSATAATEMPSASLPQKLPPRWFIRAAWVVHRAIHRLTGGRRGLAHPKPDRAAGYLRLTTVGRRTGRERAAIVCYIEDGKNLVTLAMNGWAAADPAWWLNLQADPIAIVDVKGEVPRPIRARAAVGAERERLWKRLRAYAGWARDLDAQVMARPGETTVVVLEPRS